MMSPGEMETPEQSSREIEERSFSHARELTGEIAHGRGLLSANEGGRYAVRICVIRGRGFSWRRADIYVKLYCDDWDHVFDRTGTRFGDRTPEWHECFNAPFEVVARGARGWGA